MSEIVVGLDVSWPSQRALAWAAIQARSTGAELRAVHALPVPAGMLAAADLLSASASVVADDRVEQAYRDAVEAVWETAQPEPGWVLEFYYADPGRLLVKESAQADLLVVGTREHVGWGRILNGSVSHYCLSHAACPVVAVPPETVLAEVGEPQLVADAAPR